MRNVVINLALICLVILSFWLLSESNEQPNRTIEYLIAESTVDVPPILAEKLPKKVAVDLEVILERPCHGSGYGKYSELLWLACAIYHEARGEVLEGQLAVAESILVRVVDPRWPNTVAGVVSQGQERLNRCQYSFMCDGKPDHIMDVGAWMKTLRVAQYALARQLFSQQTSCAHSYHADWMTNKAAKTWFATLKRERQVGRHIFFCDQNKNGQV